LESEGKSRLPRTRLFLYGGPILLVLFLLSGTMCASVPSGDREPSSIPSGEAEDRASSTASRESQEEPASTEPVYSHSVSERIKIFYDLVDAEDRAQAEANRLEPEPEQLEPEYSSKWKGWYDRMDKLRSKFEEQYRDEVIKKHELSQEELSAITEEGLSKRWPPLTQ